jgi:hypothetical protein
MRCCVQVPDKTDGRPTRFVPYPKTTMGCDTVAAFFNGTSVKFRHRLGYIGSNPRSPISKCCWEKSNTRVPPTHSCASIIALVSGWRQRHSQCVGHRSNKNTTLSTNDYAPPKEPHHDDDDEETEEYTCGDYWPSWCAWISAKRVAWSSSSSVSFNSDNTNANIVR